MNGTRVALLLLLLVALGVSGCGDDEDLQPVRTPTATAAPVASATPVGNRAPELAPIGNHSVHVGDDLLIALQAADPDGDELQFTVQNLPTDSYFLTASGMFCLLPTDASVGKTFLVTFFASDGQLSDEETVSIRVLPAASGGVGGGGPTLVFRPLDDQTVRAGETLSLQLEGSGPSPLLHRMVPEPALAPLVTLDAQSGAFTFAPTAAHVGRRFEITFQVCVPDGDGCSADQEHQTIYLTVAPALACPDYVPEGCEELAPGSDTLPKTIDRCMVIRHGGPDPYVFGEVNILHGGALYFVEDPGQTIDFRVQSLLVEMGGVLQAGSPDCPFGAQGPKLDMAGGALSIGLYGDDPSKEFTVKPAPRGIDCKTSPGAVQPCFPAEFFDPPAEPRYCTTANSDNPCASTVVPPTDAPNYKLEHYGELNFDPTPWGYKVLGVSYGGSLKLFGHKGAKPLQDSTFAARADSDDHCAAPTAAQSTLDAAEMQDWADLSGSSWARLDASAPADGPTTLTLDRLLPDWTVGDEIVVGTTDWYPSHSEVRAVRGVRSVRNGAGAMVTQLTVDALRYPHASAIFDAKQLERAHGAEYTDPVNRSAADLRAVVGLLTRSIRIRSLGKEPQSAFPAVEECLYDSTTAGHPADPACYFGGHVIVRQGFAAAQLQGVEFRQLGQGGRMGHYPVHFHLAKSTAYARGQAFVKDSAVWDSMTRFITLHGTLNVTLARNVGFLSMGHGYYLEDGSEIENLLCHNLGVSARGSLTEFFAAQADRANWSGTPPAPSLAARFVPPILDGVSPTVSLQECPPPCPPDTTPCPTEPTSPCPPILRTGSDSYMPVMFWAMNAHNEFVGNAAVGVHGFGSCYWLLGSTLSGPSAITHQFAGYAKYNTGGYQAPLLRFRGNSCGTSPLALPASVDLPPAGIGDALNTGYTAVPNPYIAGKLSSQVRGQYLRPVATSNFQPIPIDSPSKVCASVGLSDAELDSNLDACVTTVVDRFTTSFNWAQVNFGSVWLRPWFYLFLNGAMTDQLFGGLTFVSSGSWLQVPPGYFSLAKNSLFVGTTQHGGSRFATRSGPIFSVGAGTNLANYAPCSMGGRNTCNLLEEGTGYWQGSVQPKRLINIYDGPHYADGNLFLNIGSFECNPQPCAGTAPGAPCTTDLACGIYSSTVQPLNRDALGTTPKMVVVDAAIGWKQPNGFYYPPAFTYRASNFFKALPTGLPDPDPANPLNQCFSRGEANDFMGPSELPGGCRHNTLDRTAPYITGSMQNLAGVPTIIPPGGDTLSLTPIDFSTILVDVDSSLTGAAGQISGVMAPVPTSSVSRNSFFDAPAQSDECLSFGVQTSPYQFVTTVIAPLKSAPSGTTYVEPWTYRNQFNQNKIEGSSPVIAIYRQWKTAGDGSDCDLVCDATNPTNYGCKRASFMVGPNVGQAPHLTMTEPPGLTGQAGALYYIDTNTDATQPLSCLGRGRTNAMRPAPFERDTSYVVYNMFARADAVSSYQVYVGEGVADPAAVRVRYVRVKPHLTAADNTNNLQSFRSQVTDACDPSIPGQWCSSMPKPTLDTASGVLTFKLDQREIAADFEPGARAPYELCMPRDLCYFDATSQRCRFCRDGGTCAHDSLLPVDVPALNEPTASERAPLDVICQDWVNFTSGTTPTANGGEISLADCPANGCLGFAFTLPSNFVGNKTYAEVNPPVYDFDPTSWADNQLIQRKSMEGTPLDPLCGAPQTGN